MSQKMGFDFGLEQQSQCFQRKYQWLLKIDDVSASGVSSLPPLKSARPSLSFKEMEVNHLTETIFYPSKPEFKPINLTLYDLVQSQNPVLAWIKKIYDASNNSTWQPSGDNNFKQTATLEMLDGCGNTQETWIFENAWPQTIEWGDLDMGSSEIVTVDITLRYDRAYVDNGN